MKRIVKPQKDQHGVEQSVRQTVAKACVFTEEQMASQNFHSSPTAALWTALRAGSTAVAWDLSKWEVSATTDRLTNRDTWTINYDQGYVIYIYV